MTEDQTTMLLAIFEAMRGLGAEALQELRKRCEIELAILEPAATTKAQKEGK
jgi:hypothetical protein